MSTSVRSKPLQNYSNEMMERFCVTSIKDPKQLGEKKSYKIQSFVAQISWINKYFLVLKFWFEACFNYQNTHFCLVIFGQSCILLALLELPWQLNASSLPNCTLSQWRVTNPKNWKKILLIKWVDVQQIRE